MDLFNSFELDINLPEKEGYSHRFIKNLNLFEIEIPNGKILYSKHFFDKKISDRSLEYLLENKSYDIHNTNWREINPSNVEWNNIKWRQDKIKMFGKEVLLPRYSAWYGDDNKPYTYSGITLYPNTWNKGLEYLKHELEKLAEVDFNSVLLNWYRDGNDSISWHTDAEKELGKNPVIGSVNFGATRKFQLRRIDNKKEKIEIPLSHGTVLIMIGETQHYWQHSVPKEKKIDKLRINLTFRQIK
jgi:alkylated DNA repair dioxygenase AlkB